MKSVIIIAIIFVLLFVPMNVFAELVEYTPLNLDRITTLIETGRSYKTIQG